MQRATAEYEYDISDKSSDFVYRPVIYAPIVKNWHNPTAYKNDNKELIQPTYAGDHWVYYPRNSSITARVKTKFENNFQPTITLFVEVSFDTGAYCDEELMPQFVPPYQDRVSICVQPERKDCSKLTALTSYGHYINDSANANESIEKVSYSRHISGSLEGGCFPAHAKLDFQGQSSKCVSNIHGYDFLSTASEFRTLHAGSQQLCFYKNKPYNYDVRNPDTSMHWYGHCPDYFCTPSKFAQGGLKFSTRQSYVLHNEHKSNTPISFAINVNQHLVTMGIWRWCANHWFDQQSICKYVLDVSTIANDSFVSKCGFFRENNQKNCTQGMGPVQKITWHRNDSWGGPNYTPETLVKNSMDRK